MAIIKSYTDISQSKNLAKILPLESADMCIGNYVGESGKVDGTNIHYYPKGESFGAPEIICAWSLAALLNIIPKDESIDCSISFGYYNGKGKYIEKWLCTFEKEDEIKDGFIIETIDGDNPIDVLYEMILELNTLNML